MPRTESNILALRMVEINCELESPLTMESGSLDSTLPLETRYAVITVVGPRAEEVIQLIESYAHHTQMNNERDIAHETN